MTLAERVAAAVVLGVLWAWLILQETGLADRAAPASSAAAIILIILMVGLQYVLLERMTNGHHKAPGNGTGHCSRH